MERSLLLIINLWKFERKADSLMQNLQNIPGDTDVDNSMPNEINPNENNRNERHDYPLPTDKIPPAPVKEPNTEVPINEIPREPKRIMSYFTASQRRIF